MSLVAAFLWKKSSNCISTLIFDDKTMVVVSPPKIKYIPRTFFRFKRDAHRVIKKFFEEIIYFHKHYKQPIKVEYKIVFIADNIPYIVPARESQYVYKTFFNFLKIAKKKTNLKVCPQLRNRLSGKPLKLFNKGLRTMGIVRRKTTTRFEYNLWAIAVHATPSTYEKKITQMKHKLMKLFWQTPS